MLSLLPVTPCSFLFFFFNDTATTEIYTLSLHDALPISRPRSALVRRVRERAPPSRSSPSPGRSEEHTSELQSRPHLVCRLLLEKKKRANTGRTRMFWPSRSPVDLSLARETYQHHDVTRH